MQGPYDRELLERFAYEEWLKRGRPLGSPEVDWAAAKARIAREDAIARAAADIAPPEATRPKKRPPAGRTTSLSGKE